MVRVVEFSPTPLEQEFVRRQRSHPGLQVLASEAPERTRRRAAATESRMRVRRASQPERLNWASEQVKLDPKLEEVAANIRAWAAEPRACPPIQIRA